MSAAPYLRAPHLALLAAPLLLALVLLGAAFGWVQAKHQRAQQQLNDLAPRYARLLGMQAQQGEIVQALQSIAAVKAEHVYPGEIDATQTGNALQQRLRDALTRAGVSVLSSQVRVLPNPDAEPAPYQRIDVLVSVDGSWEAVQMALLATAELRPSVWLDDVRITLMGNLQSNAARLGNRPGTTRAEAPARLQAQLVFHILRSNIASKAS